MYSAGAEGPSRVRKSAGSAGDVKVVGEILYEVEVEVKVGPGGSDREGSTIFILKVPRRGR